MSETPTSEPASSGRKYYKIMVIDNVGRHLSITLEDADVQLLSDTFLAGAVRALMQEVGTA